MTECFTCGHPVLRPDGHAPWCIDGTFIVNIPKPGVRLYAPCPHCGRLIRDHLTRHQAGPHCQASA